MIGARAGTSSSLNAALVTLAGPQTTSAHPIQKMTPQQSSTHKPERYRFRKDLSLNRLRLPLEILQIRALQVLQATLQALLAAHLLLLLHV